MREYRRIDADYLDTAPVRLLLRQEIPASAAATFRSFEDAGAWPTWCLPIDSVTWTSPEPFGSDSTRDISGRAGVISEQFFAWDVGTRIAFCFARGQVPLFEAFAEEYVLVPIHDTQCQLVWRCGFEAPPRLRVTQPTTRVVFNRIMRRSFSRLAVFMAENRSQYED